MPWWGASRSSSRWTFDTRGWFTCRGRHPVLHLGPNVFTRGEGTMIKRFLLLACCAVLASAQGCDKSGNGSSTKTIGVVPKGTSHVFWKSVKAGADKAGKE